MVALDEGQATLGRLMSNGDGTFALFETAITSASNTFAAVGKLTLRLQRLLKEVARLTVLRILEVCLAILRALQRVVENRDHIKGLVASTGLLALLV